MLVTFKTDAHADIMMFGDVALTLLKLMGLSGRVPGALLAEEIPTARPRRRTNHRTTVALHGTHAALIPNAAITPRPM